MFFELQEGGEKAFLVHVGFINRQDNESVDEFIQLSISAGLSVLGVMEITRKTPSPKTFIGQGKCEELHAEILGVCAEVVLFDVALSPSQQRNLEKILGIRVIDRIGLILDIFAQRARTHEGKLQVELAQLQYVSTRLIRGWTHLERQKGGIGLRGPGETQLETDRRLIRARIKHIEKRLEKVKKQRHQGRRSRSRAEIPTVAIVGYTNAGKSTLFNQLTSASVYAADQLFATLDPTLRRIDIPKLGPVILADTVGFIKDLPHKLIDAFKATLEETVEADLLLHVVDAAADDKLDNIDQVNAVLKEIGADEKKQIMVYNKIDLLHNVAPSIDGEGDQSSNRVWLSAQKELGFNLLLGLIAEKLTSDSFHGQIRLSPAQGELRSYLYRNKWVMEENFEGAGNQLLEVTIPLDEISKIEHRLAVDWQALVVDNGNDSARSTL